MISRIITIDQSTSATKAMLFSEDCELLHRVNIEHQQFYPQIGWVEHDAEEIYKNTIEAIHCLLEQEEVNGKDISYSLAITNQRETVVVWNRHTGKSVYHAVVWQCQRGAAICKELKDKGYSELVQRKTGLLIDPYFSASGAKWILDNVENARELAEKGDLLMGTIDSWLIWKLTEGRKHLTDYTNASRTMLFNIHTLDWDEELLKLFTIPRNMMPEALPCDAVFGETTIEGLFKSPIQIAGVLGDSHGALTGQMCFEAGMESIGALAFKGCTKLASAALGNSLTLLGDSAFYGCSALQSVELPVTVSSVGTRTFAGCSALNAVGLGNVSAIGEAAFNGCSALTEIAIPNGVETLGNYAFYGCSALATVTLGTQERSSSSLKTIGDYAFAETAVKSVVLPDGVSTLGNYAFNKCASLATVSLGNSLTAIGNYAFSDCEKLES